jgi:sigma-54 dependent transcriptional regulator, acetoin dehydrogenase operon transcriptional activator AcoR
MRAGIMNALNLNNPVIAGKSPEITRIKKALKVLANESGSVLFIGEAGSGKNQLAEKIHQIGKRSEHPFVSIECGALGDTIDIDDVFPYSPNTENYEDFQFFSAGQGTLLLNGIDRLDSALQDKLYNFLITLSHKAKEYKFETRIISSADPSIEDNMRNKDFRPDLFQLLGEYRLQLPPIRDRKQDIPHVFTQYLEQFCDEFSKPIPVVPFEVFESVLEYDWPGNITELRNCVRNLLVMSPDGELSPDYLPFRVQPNPLEALAARDLPSAVSEVEKFLIRKALARFEGNQSKASRVLQVSEAALRYKMKKYGLPSFK